MRLLCACPVVVAALGLIGCGDDRPEGETSKATGGAIAFPLHEEHHSGRHGEATLEAAEASAPIPGAPRGEGMRVTVRLAPATGEANPAHIHNVTCAEYRAMRSFNEQLATVEDGLSALEHGRSETVVTTKLAARTNGHYSINVHKPAHPYEVIACGDIPRR